jgi:hypothetical protein
LNVGCFYFSDFSRLETTFFETLRSTDRII